MTEEEWVDIKIEVKFKRTYSAAKMTRINLHSLYLDLDYSNALSCINIVKELCIFFTAQSSAQNPPDNASIYTKEKHKNVVNRIQKFSDNVQVRKKVSQKVFVEVCINRKSADRQ